jgi:hypothetical protein
LPRGEIRIPELVVRALLRTRGGEKPVGQLRLVEELDHAAETARTADRSTKSSASHRCLAPTARCTRAPS